MPPIRAAAQVEAGPRFPVWLSALSLLLLTALAYQPVWEAGFIWDDDAYVTENAMLTAPNGWSQIWFSAHRQSQYFPMTYTTLRFEQALWGLNPHGYHAANVLLHALNALVLWRLIRRLAVPGAWLAAAIFALHPIQVESVAFALLLWWRRRALGRGFTAGVVFFVAALSPLLGFIPLYTFRFSFVADHYQYLACTGLIIPAAALISSRLSRECDRRAISLCLPGSLLLVLGLLTWKRAHIFADEKMLWQDTRAKNPTSWMARCNLAYTSL